MDQTLILSVPELDGIDGLQWISAEQDAGEIVITTTLHAKATRGALFNKPELLALTGGRIGEYGWYTSHTVQYGGDPQYDRLTLIGTDLKVPIKNGYYSRFEAQSRATSRPLEEKTASIANDASDETYKTFWNHHVASTDKTEVIDDVTWEGITDGTIPETYTAGTATWIKSNQGIPAGYTIRKGARFPGVQGYAVGEDQVKEIIYARSQSVIKDIIQAVGRKRAPRDSAGNYYDVDRTDDSKWLITSSSERRSLGWYEAEVTYAYAKGGWLDRDAAPGDTGVYPVWNT